MAKKQAKTRDELPRSQCEECMHAEWFQSKSEQFPYAEGHCNYRCESPKLPMAYTWLIDDFKPWGGHIYHTKRNAKDCACFEPKNPEKS